MDQEYITVKAAATLCKVSVVTIHKWLRLGHIDRYAADNGYNVLINRQQLLTFDRARRNTKRNVKPRKD